MDRWSIAWELPSLRDSFLDVCGAGCKAVGPNYYAAKSYSELIAARPTRGTNDFWNGMAVLPCPPTRKLSAISGLRGRLLDQRSITDHGARRYSAHAYK